MRLLPLPHLPGRGGYKYMYKMTEDEFQGYLDAGIRYELLYLEQQEELEEAYEDIFGTQTGWDYVNGSIYSETLNVADYAIYLVELKEKHKKVRELCERRVWVFKRAFELLTDEEKFIYRNNSRVYKNYDSQHEVLRKLQKHIEEIVSTIPDLQEKEKKFFESEREARVVAAYDRMVDKMSVDDLVVNPQVVKKSVKPVIQLNLMKDLNPKDTNFFEKFSKAASEMVYKNVF